MEKEELRRDGNSEGMELSIGFPMLGPINKRTINKWMQLFFFWIHIHIPHRLDFFLLPCVSHFPTAATNIWSDLHSTGVHKHTTPAAEADELHQVPFLVPSCSPSSRCCGASVMADNPTARTMRMTRMTQLHWCQPQAAWVPDHDDSVAHDPDCDDPDAAT